MSDREVCSGVGRSIHCSHATLQGTGIYLIPDCATAERILVARNHASVELVEYRMSALQTQLALSLIAFTDGISCHGSECTSNVARAVNSIHAPAVDRNEGAVCCIWTGGCRSTAIRGRSSLRTDEVEKE